MGVSKTRVLALFAHPDDETLSAGPLLAHLASRGVHTEVVTATRGERGEIITPALRDAEGDHPRMREIRTREVKAACAALGVSEHRFLDELPSWEGPLIEDSGMRWLSPGIAGPAAQTGPNGFTNLPLEELTAALAAHLEGIDLIITEEPGGGYGHPDHVRVSEVAALAVSLLEPAKQPVLAYAVSERLAWERAWDYLDSLPRPLVCQGGDGAEFSGVRPPQAPPGVWSAADIALSVPGIGWRGAPLRALGEYRTQVRGICAGEPPAGAEREYARWCSVGHDEVRPLPDGVWLALGNCGRRVTPVELGGLISVEA